MAKDIEIAPECAVCGMSGPAHLGVAWVEVVGDYLCDDCHLGWARARMPELHAACKRGLDAITLRIPDYVPRTVEILRAALERAESLD